MLSEGFSQRLRARMQRVGIQANELAERVGVTPGAVGNWMSGENEAKGSNLRKVAEVLKCDPAWLIDGDQAGDKSEMSLREPPAESELELWKRRAKEAEKRLAQVQAGLRFVLSIGSNSLPADVNSKARVEAEAIVDAIEHLADQNLNGGLPRTGTKSELPPPASLDSNTPPVE